MRTVGIRDLKARLSQYLRDVQRGETLLVTDRGRVVAEIRRPGASDWPSESPADRALARMSAEGGLRLAERRVDPYPPSPIKSPAGTGRRLLDQDRGDR